MSASPTIPAAVIAASQAAQARWYVPSSVSIAQWGLESAWGLHLPKGSNNPFGIKARDGQAYVTAMTWEHVSGHDVRVEQRFAKYADLAEAFDAHARLLATSALYKPAMDAWYHAHDLADGIAKMAQHYATDPAYGTKLLALIHANDLVRFDTLPADRAKTAAVVKASPAAPTPAAPAAPGFTEMFDRLGEIFSDLKIIGAALRDVAPTLQSAGDNPLNALTTMSSLFALVQTFGPLIPEVVKEVPDIAAKAGKLATDVRKMDVTATIADFEALVAAAEVPFHAITKTIEGSHTMTAPAA